MKKKALVFSVIFAFWGVYSCDKKENIKDPGNQESGKLPINGHYLWTFEIPNIGMQESHLTIYADSIRYIMSGAAYSTNYLMLPESANNKNEVFTWIGRGEGGSIPKDGKYFVLFFKDIQETSFMLYKHEADSKAAAQDFPVPDEDATEDHGWNLYLKK